MVATTLAQPDEGGIKRGVGSDIGEHGHGGKQ
jgi:hypothetical protein